MRRIISLVIAASLHCSGFAQAADYVAMSGQQLYTRLCASCHGTQGRGDGPVASSFTIEVPDLTLIARRAGGRFPRDRVLRIIDGRSIIGAHGSRTMPVWGEDLSRLQVGDPSAQRTTQIIIDRLADFVLLLQRPTQN
jgi:mono/diheme cytochrome c family protein